MYFKTVILKLLLLQNFISYTPSGG